MRKYLFIIFLAGFTFPALSHALFPLMISNTDSILAKEAVNHYNETIIIYGTVSGWRWLQTSFLTLINLS